MCAFWRTSQSVSEAVPTFQSYVGSWLGLLEDSYQSRRVRKVRPRCNQSGATEELGGAWRSINELKGRGLSKGVGLVPSEAGPGEILLWVWDKVGAGPWTALRVLCGAALGLSFPSRKRAAASSPSNASFAPFLRHLEQ